MPEPIAQTIVPGAFVLLEVSGEYVAGTVLRTEVDDDGKVLSAVLSTPAGEREVTL